MITTEKAFDMLPYAVAIIEKLDIQEQGKKILEEIQAGNPDLPPPELQHRVGMAVLMYVVKNLEKVKNEFFQLLAIASDVDVETAKARPLKESIATVKEVFLDSELMDFFAAVGR